MTLILKAILLNGEEIGVGGSKREARRRGEHGVFIIAVPYVLAVVLRYRIPLKTPASFNRNEILVFDDFLSRRAHNKVDELLAFLARRSIEVHLQAARDRVFFI
jgi:hypothetical protein